MFDDMLDYEAPVDKDGYRFLSNLDEKDRKHAKKAAEITKWDIKVKDGYGRFGKDQCSVWSKDGRSHEPFWNKLDELRGKK